MVKKLFTQSQHMLTRQQSGILSAAGLITISSLVSALLGLLRNRLLVARFFETPELQAQLDAYWVAFRLPELAFQLLVIGSISAAFIPVYSKFLKKDKDDAEQVANSMLNLVLLVFLGISLVIFIFAEQLVSLITSENFTMAQVQLAANLSRVMLLAQFFFGISNFMTGIIQSNKRFLVPALAPVVYNLGIILGILSLSPVMGIYGPAAGVVLGALLHLLIQVPLVRQLGHKYRFKINVKHKGVKSMARLMPPRILAISINQVEVFASVYFATALPSGSLTIMNLAQQLISAPNRIFSVPLGQASLPFLSQKVADDNMEGFKSIFAGTLRHIMFLALPSTMMLLILRIPLVRIAYGSSEFPWEATILTGKVVAILSLALFAQGGINLLVRAFYAMHNTWLPFLVSLVSVTLNIFLSYLAVFVYSTGVLGLSLAISVSSVVHFSLLMLSINRYVPGLLVKDVLLPTLKILLASAIMAVFLWVPMRLLDQFVFDTTRTVPLIILTVIAGLIGGWVYLLLTRWFKVDEYATYARFFRRFGKVQALLLPTEEIIETPTQSQEIKPL